MSKKYTNVMDYANAVEKAMPMAIEKYVAPHIRAMLQKYIIHDIYMKYKRKNGGWLNGETYHRRFELYNDVDSWIDGDKLIVTSVGVPDASIIDGDVYGGSDGGFLTLLASGNMGISGCQFPRPVIPQAQDAVEKRIEQWTKILVHGLEKML